MLAGICGAGPQQDEQRGARLGTRDGKKLEATVPRAQRAYGVTQVAGSHDDEKLIGNGNNRRVP